MGTAVQPQVLKESVDTSPPPRPVFPPEVLKHVSFWMRVFMEDWHGEIPLRIHSWELGEDGAPDWHPDFARWIEKESFEGGAPDHSRAGTKRNSDQRIRTTRAFRKLRRVAPREFDVLYCLVVHQMTLGAVATAMTARAIRIGKPERYTPTGVLVLTVSAVEKVASWW